MYKDSNGDLWYCVASGTPGTFRKLSGASGAGSLHLLASPARPVDTRSSGGPFASGEVRAYNISTLTGGAVPAGATGVLGNVTVADSTAPGYGQVFPANLSSSPTSTVNFRAGVNTANAFTSALSGGSLKVAIVTSPAGTAQVILDIIGYYL